MTLKTIAGCLTGLAVALSAHAAGANTLVEELQGLLESHPQIEGSRQTVLAAEEQVDQAFAGYLPKVNLLGDAGWEHVDTPSTRARTSTGGSGTFDGQRRTAGIVATQLLYDGGLTSSSYGSAQLQNTQANTELSATRQNVLFEGISAYLTVMRQRELVRLSAQNEDNIKRQLNLEDERVRRGSGIAVDVLQAKSRLQLAKERRVATEGALRDAITRYVQVFGHAPDESKMTAPAAPLGAIPETIDEVIAIALQENPSITSAQTQIAIADEQVDAAHAGYLPTVNLEVAGNYNHDKDYVTNRRDVSVLVKANWNIFNGFATRAGVARASFEHAASQNNQQYVRRKIEEQARLAWQALDTARQRVALLENAVNIADEVFTSRRRLREAGKENAITVLDAENEVFTARINYTAALYDARLASYQVLLAMGRLGEPSVVAQDGGKALAVRTDG
ncbi:TolC family outer membrane protein [Novispirillum sp. DQ9]|uniref:TolC family outer membrane protein n=1 Tax=Novispirillum sp. DQ9 TaxID=3398612 RepID=UPI003C7B8551